MPCMYWRRGPTTKHLRYHSYKSHHYSFTMTDSQDVPHSHATLTWISKTIPCPAMQYQGTTNVELLQFCDLCLQLPVCSTMLRSPRPKSPSWVAAICGRFPRCKSPGSIVSQSHGSWYWLVNDMCHIILYTRFLRTQYINIDVCCFSHQSYLNKDRYARIHLGFHKLLRESGQKRIPVTASGGSAQDAVLVLRVAILRGNWIWLAFEHVWTTKIDRYHQIKLAQL